MGIKDAVARRLAGKRSRGEALDLWRFENFENLYGEFGLHLDPDFAYIFVLILPTSLSWFCLHLFCWLYRQVGFSKRRFFVTNFVLCLLLYILSSDLPYILASDLSACRCNLGWSLFWFCLHLFSDCTGKFGFLLCFFFCCCENLMQKIQLKRSASGIGAKTMFFVMDRRSILPFCKKVEV